jgi:serine/threonine-protein kinase
MPDALNDKYLLDHRLGTGGMAEVFLGRTLGAEGFSRPVAIKRVLAGFSENPEFARLFVSEAQLTARLQHPNIVSVLDFDRDAGGRLFLVMELVDGTDLRGLLATGPLPFSLVIHLGVEILRGLAYAHVLPDAGDQIRGIVHRDISPHNVLLSWEGAVKVSDFGIAKARAATAATASTTVRGKPAYMSPEQAKGEPLDGRSDLFSVGAILFEALCARQLFGTGDLVETIARLLHAPIPSLREDRPDVPEDLAAVVDSLIARDPARRPQSAAAAIAALVACRDYPRNGRDEFVTTLASRLGRVSVRARRGAASSGAASSGAASSGAASSGAASSGAASSPGASNAALGRAHVGSGTPPSRTITPPAEARLGRRVWPWIVLLGLATGGGAVAALRSSSCATAPPSAATAASPATSPPPAQSAATPPPAPTAPPPAALPAQSATPPPAPPATAASTGAPLPAQDSSHNTGSAPRGASPRTMPAPQPPPHHDESSGTGSKPALIHEIQLRPNASGA